LARVAWKVLRSARTLADAIVGIARWLNWVSRRSLRWLLWPLQHPNLSIPIHAYPVHVYSLRNVIQDVLAHRELEVPRRPLRGQPHNDAPYATDSTRAAAALVDRSVADSLDLSGADTYNEDF